jgi:hypothetical protein
MHEEQPADAVGQDIEDTGIQSSKINIPTSPEV